MLENTHNGKYKVQIVLYNGTGGNTSTQIHLLIHCMHQDNDVIVK